MSTVGSADVQIFPTFKGFRAEVVGQVDSSAADAGGRFSGAFGKAAKGLGAVLAVGIGGAIAGIAAVAGKGLSRALNLQDAEAQLRGLGHSAESVETIMGSALESVRGTAFGLDAAATIAASAVAAGIAPGEALTRTLKLTADAATIAKVPLSEMGDLVNKVATNGKLSTDVLNQFHGRGVPLLQMVADEYGVTSEAASEMVTKGEIDFAGFQRAIEAGVGGAALASGETARGAWANVGSAWGRLGAMFVGSAVDGAPVLFVAIAGAVDRLTTALEPLSGEFSGRLTPALAALAGWIDRVDFGVIIGGITGVTSLVANGQFTAGLRNAFNVEKDSPVIGVILRVRDGITGLFDLIVNGDFTGAFSRAFNVEEDSPIVDTLLTMREAVTGFFSDIGVAFQTGDFAGIWDSFGEIGAAVNPIIPVLVAAAGAIGGIAATVGNLIAAGIPLLVPILESFTDILGWLGDNAGLITPIILALAAGFLVYRAAQVASIGAAIVSLPLTALQIAADFARTRALVVNTNAMLANNVSQSAGTLVRTPATASILANAAAMVTQRVAAVAGTIAQKAAVISQVALNAAMSANPIAIVLIAIVALVAGLVWFFTQTEVGKAAWASFTQFLSEAWANMQAAAVAVFTALGSFFSATWATITGLFRAAIAFILNLFFTFHPLGIIIANWSKIVSYFGTAMSNIGSAVQSGVTNAVGFIAGLPDRALSALGSLSTKLKDSGRALIQGFIDGISGMLSKVGDAVGGVMDFVSGFFPNSPAKRGPLSGSGWRRIKSAGAAVMEEFGDGANSVVPGMNAKFAGLAVSPALSVRPTQAQRGSAQHGAARGGDVITFTGPMGMMPADVANEFTKKKRRVNALNGVGSVGVA